MSKTRVIGVDKFRMGLAVSVQDTRIAVSDELRAMATEVVIELKARCPSVTGALRESIKYVQASPTKLEIWVGDKVAYYAANVEYGTSRAPAHPFVRPVIAEFRKSAPRQIEQLVSQTWSGK